MDRDARQNLRDGFAYDMAEHQRLTGQEPTPAANERLAVPMFEMLEQKLEERRQRAALQPEPVADARGELESSALRDECRRRGRETAADFMSIRRMEDKAPIAVASDPADVERGMRMLKRLELLLGKPESGPLGAASWRERAMAVLALKMVKAPKSRIAYELAALCEESILPFGPWDVPDGAGRPLFFSP